GNDHPAPRNSLLILTPSANSDSPGGHDRAVRQVYRIVASIGSIAVARGWLAVDLHRRTADPDRRPVSRRLLKGGARRQQDMRRRVVGAAANRCGRQAHNPDVATQPPVHNPTKREGL